MLSLSLLCVSCSAQDALPRAFFLTMLFCSSQVILRHEQLVEARVIIPSELAFERLVDSNWKWRAVQLMSALMFSFSGALHGDVVTPMVSRVRLAHRCHRHADCERATGLWGRNTPPGTNTPPTCALSSGASRYTVVRAPFRCSRHYSGICPATERRSKGAHVIHPARGTVHHVRPCTVTDSPLPIRNATRLLAQLGAYSWPPTQSRRTR